MRWKIEPLIAEPAVMSFCPWGMAAIGAIKAQEEAVKLLPRHPLLVAGRRATAHEIAHGFVARVGNPDGRQLTGAMQFGEHEGVASIRFDPIAWPMRDVSRSDDDAVVSGVDDLTMEAVAAWPGFVAAMQFDIGVGNLFEQSGEGFRGIFDGAVASDITVSFGIGKGNGNGFFVDIEAHVEGKNMSFLQNRVAPRDTARPEN